MKDYNKLINKLLRISEDMRWELLMEAAMAIRELQQDAARYQWLRHGDNDELVLQSYAVTRKPQMFLPRKENLDTAIDAAMKETE